MNKFGMITLPNHGSGYYSNYLRVLSMIIDADMNNVKPYVNLNQTAFLEKYNPYLGGLPTNPENTWDWWFDQETPTELDIIENIEYSLKNFSHSEKVWKRADIPHARMIANKYIKIKQHILEQINDYYNNHLKNHVVLGIMARGSEMNTWHPEYGNQSIDTWISSTRFVLEKHPEISLIFLVTEDSNYIPIYLNEFPNTLYLKNVFRRTTESLEFMIRYPLWSCIVQPRENHCRILGEECLVQAQLLSKCDYLLVKQCGTSSAAILFAEENLKEVYYT